MGNTIQVIVDLKRQIFRVFILQYLLFSVYEKNNLQGTSPCLWLLLLYSNTRELPSEIIQDLS